MQMAAKAGGLARDVLLQRMAGAQPNEGFSENVGEAGSATSTLWPARICVKQFWMEICDERTSIRPTRHS